jgi:hypothetical protein
MFEILISLYMYQIYELLVTSFSFTTQYYHEMTTFTYLIHHTHDYLGKNTSGWLANKFFSIKTFF